MKTIFYAGALLFLISCHPPEVTKIIVNAIDPTTNESIDSLNCTIFESGIIIAEQQTKGGQAQMAFDMKSNMSYELKVEGPENSKYLLVQSPGLGISIGKKNAYNLKFVGYGNFDLGLKTNQTTTSNDYLEYQIEPMEYYEAPPVSNGWSYSEPDIHGEQDDQHFINHELPAGKYKMYYRVYRNGYSTTNNYEFTIISGQTYSYVLNY